MVQSLCFCPPPRLYKIQAVGTVQLIEHDVAQLLFDQGDTGFFGRIQRPVFGVVIKQGTDGQAPRHGQVLERAVGHGGFDLRGPGFRLAFGREGLGLRGLAPAPDLGAHALFLLCHLHPGDTGLCGHLFGLAERKGFLWAWAGRYNPRRHGGVGCHRVPSP